MHACHKDSDIDLFVITQKNRLWTVRIIITFIFALFRERKTSTKHAGKFCLSFFITEETLDFSSIAIEQDIYLAYWIETLVPIYDKNQCLKNFRAANNWYEFEIHPSLAHATSPLPNPLPLGEGTSCILQPHLLPLGEEL